MVYFEMSYADFLVGLRGVLRWVVGIAWRGGWWAVTPTLLVGCACGGSQGEALPGAVGLWAGGWRGAVVLWANGAPGSEGQNSGETVVMRHEAATVDTPDVTF